MVPAEYLEELKRFLEVHPGEVNVCYSPCLLDSKYTQLSL